MRLGFLIRRRLIAPLLRGRHTPEYTARGVLFGLIVAMTPTVGVQMAIVFAVWLAVRRIRMAWDFHLVVALAWTWVTNLLTAPPLYYIYVVTGRLMLGRWSDLGGYTAFHERLAGAMSGHATWYQSLWVYTVNLFEAFGVPMLVGCLPWTILASWLGYRWSLRLILRIREARARRRARID